MRALGFAKLGSIDNVAMGDAPTPLPGVGEVVIALRAAALNHLDLFVAKGIPGVSISLPHIAGADGCGVIAEVGPLVEGWQVADEVVFNPGQWCGQCDFCQRGDHPLCVSFRILGEHVDGTFAEYVKVPAESLTRRPAHLNWHESSAFGLTYLTAWRMLVGRAALQAGETVLVHGIGGGVALAALDLAKRLGATVFVTSSDERKLAIAKERGADHTINYKTSDVAQQVRELTGKRGVDVVVETVGEATWMTSLRSAAKGGRIVTCGATSGPNPSEEIRIIFWKQLSILGSTMGSARDWREMINSLEKWKLKPLIDQVVALEDGREAYLRLESGQQMGKIVLNICNDKVQIEGMRALEY